MAKQPRPTTDKHDALKSAIARINKQFGEGTIMQLGNGGVIPKIQVISTGSLALDAALGIGGLPRGRVVEIFGPESSCKTTLCLQVIAEAQREGGTAAFVDAEHTLDLSYAKKLGVNTNDLLITQPDHGEQALEVVETLIRSEAVDLIVIDSVAALTPKAEIEGEMGEATMGAQARLMSQALRKLSAIIAKSRTTVIFINQIRMRLGLFFGNPETTSGGNALKFYATIRLDIRRIKPIKNETGTVGGRVRVKVVKNKLAPPFKQAEFDVLFAEGIVKTGELIDLGISHGLIQRSGAWHFYNNVRLGQGREASQAFLKDNPEIAQHIESHLKTLLQTNTTIIAHEAESYATEDFRNQTEQADLFSS